MCIYMYICCYFGMLAFMFCHMWASTCPCAGDPTICAAVAQPPPPRPSSKPMRAAAKGALKVLRGEDSDDLSAQLAGGDEDSDGESYDGVGVLGKRSSQDTGVGSSGAGKPPPPKGTPPTWGSLQTSAPGYSLSSAPRGDCMIAYPEHWIAQVFRVLNLGSNLLPVASRCAGSIQSMIAKMKAPAAAKGSGAGGETGKATPRGQAAAKGAPSTVKKAGSGGRCAWALTPPPPPPPQGAR